LLLTLHFRTDKTLSLTLRFRTDKTLSLSLCFRAEQSFPGASDELIGSQGHVGHGGVITGKGIETFNRKNF